MQPSRPDQSPTPRPPTPEFDFRDESSRGKEAIIQAVNERGYAIGGDYIKGGSVVKFSLPREDLQTLSVGHTRTEQATDGYKGHLEDHLVFDPTKVETKEVYEADKGGLVDAKNPQQHYSRSELTTDGWKTVYADTTSKHQFLVKNK